MTAIKSRVGFSGILGARKIKNSSSPNLEWKLRQATSLDQVKGRAFTSLAKRFSKVTGIPTMIGTVRAVHTNGLTGEVTDYGIVSRKMITDAFVEFVVDQLQTETSIFGDFKYHDSGVGVTGPAVGDTDIETTDGESRVSGTQIEGASAEIYKSVGTITYTSTKAITEHGLFNASTGVTLMDRSTFTAINVVNTDQIEFTYELTIDSGG